MVNIFTKAEEEIFEDEEIILDKNKIKKELEKIITSHLNQSSQKHFAFEKIIYDFFEYISIPITKTKKTRDSGLDGIIKLKANLIGEISVGLQIKYKTIDSTDIDSFIAALKLSELQIGTMVCENSRELQKYDLNNKIKTILLAKGIIPEENLINKKVSINPVSIIKFEDILNIATSEIRHVVKAVYKR